MSESFSARWILSKRDVAALHTINRTSGLLHLAGVTGVLKYVRSPCVFLLGASGRVLLLPAIGIDGGGEWLSPGLEGEASGNAKRKYGRVAEGY